MMCFLPGIWISAKCNRSCVCEVNDKQHSTSDTLSRLSEYAAFVLLQAVHLTHAKHVTVPLECDMS